MMGLVHTLEKESYTSSLKEHPSTTFHFPDRCPAQAWQLWWLAHCVFMRDFELFPLSESFPGACLERNWGSLAIDKGQYLRILPIWDKIWSSFGF